MSELAIVHFAPLELYPPVQNLLNQLQTTGQKVMVVTNESTRKIDRFNVSSRNIEIKRLRRMHQDQAAPIRYFNYLYFYLSAFFLLLRYRPSVVLYFETLSAYPVYLYKRFVNRNAEIYVHYHEYVSPEEYRSGMRLLNYFHKLEREILPQTAWLSHTNQNRMRQFEKDIYPVVIPNPRVLPNYPPLTWRATPRNDRHIPSRIVYVGALSLTTMYVKEFAEWIISQKGHALWDIYSYEPNKDVVQYLKQINSEWIQLKAGVQYHQLPSILETYDIGVILYKGHIPNYVLNAPNKLFEYFVCGLDVWLPEEMTGSLDYLTDKTYPKIIALNFFNLQSIDHGRLMDRDGLEINQSVFSCEEALRHITQSLTSHV